MLIWETSSCTLEVTVILLTQTVWGNLSEITSSVKSIFSFINVIFYHSRYFIKKRYLEPWNQQLKGEICHTHMHDITVTRWVIIWSHLTSMDLGCCGVIKCPLETSYLKLGHQPLALWEDGTQWEEIRSLGMCPWKEYFDPRLCFLFPGHPEVDSYLLLPAPACIDLNP